MNILRNIGLMIILAGLIACTGDDTPRAKQAVKAGITPVSQKSVSKAPPRPANAVKAPDFTLMSLDGELKSLSEMSGKVVLLNFWGTWCPPCRREIPDFIRMYEKYQSRGLEIVGITLSSGTKDQINAFASQWGLNYTVLTDINAAETQQVTIDYSRATGHPINGIPTTFLIDRDGYIRKSYVGPRTEAIFYRDIEPFL